MMCSSHGESFHIILSRAQRAVLSLSQSQEQKLCFLRMQSDISYCCRRPFSQRSQGRILASCHWTDSDILPFWSFQGTFLVHYRRSCRSRSCEQVYLRTSSFLVEVVPPGTLRHQRTRWYLSSRSGRWLGRQFQATELLCTSDGRQGVHLLLWTFPCSVRENCFHPGCVSGSGSLCSLGERTLRAGNCK